MLDRKIVPPIRDFDTLILPEAECRVLPNGIPLYIINKGEQDVNRIDVMFSAGRFDQKVPLAAEMTNFMLKEGAANISSSQIAEQLDYCGAWLQPSATTHNSYLTLYSLNRFFAETLPLLRKIVLEPDFPEKEFKTICARRKQQTLVDLEKVQTLAARGIASSLFGNTHPYGAAILPDDYDRLTTQDLRTFYKEHYRTDNCKIVFTGKITEEQLQLVTEAFGGERDGEQPLSSTRNFQIQPVGDRELFIEKEGATQSAVRIALPIVKREHPDYLPIRVLNTVLGGYFGSRLMANIREDKGYTYGISSSVIGLRDAAYLSVSTQTGTEFTTPLVQEVFHEIERLKSEYVPEKELSMVKSYLSGELARLFDSPFSVADAYISILANNLEFDYYNNQVAQINRMTAADLQEIARKYFIRDHFYTVVAGQKES